MQPVPVFLPEKSHGQRSLAGYNPCGRKELDMTEQLTHTHKREQRVCEVFPSLHGTWTWERSFPLVKVGMHPKPGPAPAFWLVFQEPAIQGPTVQGLAVQASGTEISVNPLP